MRLPFHFHGSRIYVYVLSRWESVDITHILRFAFGVYLNFNDSENRIFRACS